MRRHWFVPIGLSVALLALGAAVCCGTTRTVVSPAMIQPVIDGSAEGDTILVGAGTYRENLDFRDSGLVLMGTAGAEATIIDGGAHPDLSAIYCGPGVQNAVLRGLTITGSTGESTISISGATIEFADDIVRDNLAIGIDVRYGAVQIHDCQFLRNDHWTEWPSFGGALQIFASNQGAGSAVIRNNVFRGNRSGFGAVLNAASSTIEFRDNLAEDNWCAYDGGAIFMWTEIASATITGNRFLGNTAGDHGGAIAAWHVYGGNADIQYNLFDHNHALGHVVNGTGGAIHIDGKSGTFSNNTVVYNTADQTCGGGGVTFHRFAAGGPWTVERNIIAFNGERGVICDGPVSPIVIRDNIIFGNNRSDLNCHNVSSRTIATFANNVEADPLFCAPGAGDFRVATDSPALNGHEPWGMYTTAGCDNVPVRPTTWSAIKAQYR